MKTMNAKYAGRCNTCNGAIVVGESILWDRAIRGASHASCPVVVAAPVAPVFTSVHFAPVVAPAPKPVVDQSLIVKFLTDAKAHLKMPKARFLAPDGKSEFRLSMAGNTSKYPGAVQMKVAGQWVGRINADGTVAGYSVTPELLALLTKIRHEPGGRCQGVRQADGTLLFLPPATDGRPHGLFLLRLATVRFAHDTTVYRTIRPASQSRSLRSRSSRFRWLLTKTCH